MHWPEPVGERETIESARCVTLERFLAKDHFIMPTEQSRNAAQFKERREWFANARQQAPALPPFQHHWPFRK